MNKLGMWVSHELIENQKKSLFWSVVFSFSTQQQWTISWSVYDVVQWKLDFKQWPAKTSSVVRLRRSSKNASQSQTFTKNKKSLSLFGGLLSVWSTKAFWILEKPLYLRSMLSKLMRCTKNCDAYSWHWSTEWAQFFSTTMPNHMSYNQHFKSWWNWAQNFCFIHHIHHILFLANWLTLL